ncbi:hypothetical protein RAC89_20810 [Paenibacillus sp. GD4]|jgi:uncharacterized membrane protein|uniref:DUF4870 domain-containing protein n=1 Tax=Paenibacillus sp. GD4 TaxID=3068890 RepID=UPI002796C9BC|nr:DUF4870 domain-containing protein [Paenibacillus sp. GD4]MDQ1912837.1 hypothetical protein [Paenibacillus sp. GD4]
METNQTALGSYDAADVQNNKWMAVIGYILFFVPLLVAKDSRFARYHANQGLLLLLLSIAVNIVLGIIPLIGWLLLPIANLLVLIFAILGIVNAAQGQAKPLPLIGSVTIIK